MRVALSKPAPVPVVGPLGAIIQSLVLACSDDGAQHRHPADMERCRMQTVTRPDAHPYDASLTSESRADRRGTQAPDGALVVVDVWNSPADQNIPVLEFFETSIAYCGEVEHSFRLLPNGTQTTENG
jgi:hypothetical protein